MYSYQVGQLYHPSKTRWEERTQFNIRKGQCELLMFFEQPSFDEILAVKKSPAEFGIARIKGVVFFFYRFGSDIPWSDQAFSINLVERSERDLPDLPSGENEYRLPLSIMLMDARSGLIKAIRYLTLSPEYSQELVKLCREDLELGLSGGFDQQSYTKKVDQIYKLYPSTQDLLKECFVFTAGGI